MKKTLKKSLAFLLAAVLLFGATPIIGVDFSVPASAAAEGDLTFEPINGGAEYEVSSCNKTASGDLTIPSTYDGKPVTSIGNSAFYDCDSLINVILPNSVTSIGKEAFRSCDSLESVNIPDGVTSIGNSAFEWSVSLKSVTIPGGVISIGDYAFYRCTSMDEAVISEGVVNIGGYAFYQAGLTEVTVPSSVTSIADKAFASCANLTKIEVAETNTKYSSENGVLFNKTKTVLMQYPAGKSGVTYTIPDSVVQIGDTAFNDCLLEALVVPASVEVIDTGALFNCDRIITITVDEGNPSYSSQDSVLFSKDKTVLYKYSPANERTAYTVPESVIEIKSYAFDNASNLTTLNFNNGLKVINNYAFNSCSGINSFSIPLSVEYIGRYAFYYTGYYHNAANWEYGLLYLDDWLLDVKSGVTQVNIKAGTRFVAQGASVSRHTVESISIPTSVERIGADAFYGTAFYYNAGNWSDDVLYIDNCLIQAKTTVSDVVIRPDTRLIADNAFNGCWAITEVQVPESVKYIGELAFSACHRLTEITIPNPATTIGKKAFNGVVDDFAIMGRSGSAAETYADDNDITFGLIPSSVTLDITSKTLAVGETQQLTAAVVPEDEINKTVTWASSDTAIATVDENGLVTAITAGEATITVTTKYGGKTATSAITVIRIPVTEVTLDITSKTLSAGETQQLTATVAPENATNKKVTWSSSNTAVATVNDNGLVTAKAAGTATITVTTEDEGKTATCTITVANNPTITIKNLNNSSSIKYGETLRLTAVTTDMPAGAKVEWSVQGTGVTLKVSEDTLTCEVTSTASGTVTVTATIVDADDEPITDAQGNEIAVSQQVKSNAGFFQKLISFFKNLFKISRIIVQSIY